MLRKKEIQDFLQEFEDKFIPTKIDPSKIEILGYGEISTVMSFKEEELKHLAFKRLPIFTGEKEACDYAQIHIEYNKLLGKLNIEVPESEVYCVKGHGDRIVNYFSQQRQHKNSIGNKIIHKHSKEESLILFNLLLDKMKKLWHHNINNPDLQLGLDSQISNWAVKNYHEDVKITEDTELLFIDTSTPFIRKKGEEQMNPLLFLESAPKPMRPVLRKFFLQDIMDRYYDFRLVAIDLLANLFKEQRVDLIEDCRQIVNDKAGDLIDEKEISYKEIEKYYKEDKFIWQLYLGARRFDRFVKVKILNKRYEYTLPGKIKR